MFGLTLRCFQEHLNKQDADTLMSVRSPAILKKMLSSVLTAEGNGLPHAISTRICHEEQGMSEPTPRTEMRCIRCGCFSSTRICWHCSNLPDAISNSLIESLQRTVATQRTALLALAQKMRQTGRQGDANEIDEILK